MAERIGEAAGKVWQYLAQKGPATPAQLSRDTGVPRESVQRAIGWLAREEKLKIEKVRNSEVISLR